VLFLFESLVFNLHEDEKKIWFKEVKIKVSIFSYAYYLLNHHLRRFNGIKF